MYVNYRVNPTPDYKLFTADMATCVSLLILALSALFGSASCIEQGKFTDVLTGSHKAVIQKTLYKDTKIKLTLGVPKCNSDGKELTLKWLVRSSTCYGEYVTIVGDDQRVKEMFEMPFLRFGDGGSGHYLVNYDVADDESEHKGDGEKIQCGQGVIVDNSTNHKWMKYPKIVHDEATTATAAQRKRRDANSGASEPAGDTADDKKSDSNEGDGSDKNPDAGSNEDKSPSTKLDKNDAANPDKPKDDPDKGEDTPPDSDKSEETKSDATKDSSTKPEDSKVSSKTHRSEDNHLITTVQYEAPYALIVSIEGSVNFTCDVTVELVSPKGYLSAHEYPLLTFYLIMCIVYALLAASWLVMSACNFRDLLRVQFWIGGVILLGMIEKAVFYSEFLSVNSTGESVIGAEKFAEVVSALKRALARMLVIIVSLGFGIVKPRLGPMLHRVIGIGMLYFILAVIEAFVRTDNALKDPVAKNTLFASIPLAVLDSIMCWWIFISLMQTMKTLRLRRNVVKLSLYRHFSNTIIFCVLASIVMIIWSVHSRDPCMSNWEELWVDTAFWHILFSVILLVIMVLWRPNINNQRYAFSPLIDGGEEEEDVEEPMLGAGATETIKMRGLKNAADPAYNPASKAEEDLKWIEENIPQTVADAALPAILDSDEEVMTTKYEMSKME